MSNHPNRSRFSRKFSDGYSLTPEQARVMRRRWQNWVAHCRRTNQRAQLNYHGCGKFSFDAFPA